MSTEDERFAARTCSTTDVPHAAHTFGGRPMQYCPGEFRQCPQCKRENSGETWAKFGGKCPNCGDLHDRETRGSEPSTPHDFNQWLTRIHGFKVGASRNSYTVADLEATWNAAERAWMEVANKNAQERNAAVDREVVLLEALRRTTIALRNLIIESTYSRTEKLPSTEAVTKDQEWWLTHGSQPHSWDTEAEAAIQQAERT